MPVNFDRDLRGADIGWDLCRLMRCLYQADPLASLRGYENYTDRVPIAIWPETAQAPLRATIHYDNVKLCLFRGVRLQATALNLFNGYLNTTQIGHLSGNPWLSARAIEIGGHMFTYDNTPQPEVWFVGHSFGGALAQLIGRDVGRWTGANRKRVRVVTFGAPKVYQRATAEQFNQDTLHARWYNDLDPVRHMPPTSSDAPAMHAALNRAVSDKVNGFTHTSMGLCLRDTGAIERRPDTPEILPIATVNLITWATGAINPTAAQHGLLEYERRLGLAKDMPQANPIVPANRPMAADVVPVPPPQNDPGVQQAFQDAVVVQVNNRSATPVRPRVPLFRARRVAGNWVVTWNGVAVAICNPKRHARSVASRGNQLLRRLEDGDIDGLNIALQAVENMANS